MVNNENFFNGKKVPVIPPLLFNSAFVNDFEEKAKIFNSFFTQLKKSCVHLFGQLFCTVSDNSILPSEFTYMTEGRIQSITFSESDVIKIIRTLDVNKAHGHDNISVRMIKLCINSVAHPLTLIFQNSMAAGTFPTQWKRANIVPIHKKNDKQIVSNYRPVSLLPICSKIFEKLFSTNFPNFLRTIICYLNINQVFARMIHVFINYLQSLMTSFYVLTAIQL